MKEIWKDIKGYEGSYQISNLGRVKGLERISHVGNGIGSDRKIPTRIMEGHLTGRNVFYKQVMLSDNDRKQQGFYIHRLVLIHFNRMPNKGEESNHIDFNPLNNRIDNLEWVTSSQNSLHSREHMSKAKRGEKHPAAKVTDLQAIEIKRLRKQKVRHRKIAEMFNITVQDSLNIATRYYSHIDHLV